MELHKIYRYLDRLHNTLQDTIQPISVAHTRRISGGHIGPVFYDASTPYFETDHSDELHARGFSRDGKHLQPHVVPGLLVSGDGYPLSYSILTERNTKAEPCFPLLKILFTASIWKTLSLLSNSTDIALLESANYRYIIEAGIKNETEEIKQWILSLDKTDGSFYGMKKGVSRLIIGYSEKRAKKDKYNREKGVKRLQTAYKSGMITREHVNRRGYNRFLEISDHVKVTVNQVKIREDERWDGWKSYLTNTELDARQVYEQYCGLWVIERAYRVTKGTLEMRLMFHFTQKRIEAHVCICFVAYKIYKELERILKISGINLSVDKVLNIAKPSLQ